MSMLWDPLEEVSTSTDEVVATARKRQIDNILKSYVGFFDPFCELIQNAMDAVDARERQTKDSHYAKRLWIEVNLQENAFSVTDNGIGFTEQQFKTFLAPNISFKSSTDDTRGTKGVGATYLAYGFNFLQMGTRTPDYEKIVEFKGGRNWVEDKNNTLTRPCVSESPVIHHAFEEIDNGSTFTLKFEGDNIRPKDLGWIGATNAEQWKAILLIKTPLGHIELKDEDGVPVVFDMTVVDRDGNRSELTEQAAKYVYPHSVIPMCFDLQDILDEQQKKINRQEVTTKSPDKFKNLNGVYGVWGPEKIIGQASFSNPDFPDLVRKYGIVAYGFFCYSVKIWDQYNDDKIKIRRGYRILQGGLQLSTNHMPQGDLIRIPLMKNIGYQNQSHVIVHFSGASPDLGRKGFQPELKDVSEQISVFIVNKLKKLRSLLKKDTGAPPAILDEGLLHDWIRTQEKHEKDNPLLIKDERFFIPINEVAITSIPACEQDVIVLFNQLLAGGVIRGIKIMATSQHEKYDGVYRCYVSKPLEHHVFDKDENPLGVQEQQYDKPYLSRPYVLEYKFNMDALIEEFENEEKREGDINLVIAWDIGSEWRKRYSVTPLLDREYLQHRPFHGSTHIFKDENSGEIRFYGIILSELLDYLDDPEGMQSVLKGKYAD